jgi:anti-sigma B factor antagonist
VADREDSVRWYGKRVVVAVPAEVDVTNSAQVDQMLADVAAQGPEIMTVDMTATNFCDSSGIHALAHAHRLVTADGGELRIAIGTSPALRVLQLTGLDQVLTVYQDLDWALSAPREQPQSA